MITCILLIYFRASVFICSVESTKDNEDTAQDRVSKCLTGSVRMINFQMYCLQLGNGEKEKLLQEGKNLQINVLRNKCAR